MVIVIAVIMRHCVVSGFAGDDLGVVEGRRNGGAADDIAEERRQDIGDQECAERRLAGAD